MEDKDKLFLSELAGKNEIAMSKQEDILAGDFGLTDEVRLSQNPPTLKRWSPAWKTVFRLDDAAKTHSGDLNAGSVIVEIMLADLLNIDDDTVIELVNSPGSRWISK